MQSLRIGYVPLSDKLGSPGDYRRFSAYAEKRGLLFERANPDEVYDLVVLSEEADVSVWSDYPHGKIVYDLIDSFLAIPRTNLKQWLRGPLWFMNGRQQNLRLNQWKAIQDMCQRADAVVCTTSEQQRDISRYCSNVHIILDIHDSVISKVKDDYCCGEPFHIVWEGLPSNLTQLNEIKSVLKELGNDRDIVLNVITDSSQPRYLGRYGKINSSDLAKNFSDKVHFHEWDKGTFSKIICKCDLAVIPIDLSDPFVTGKPENKLHLFWRMGMPVITSATPAYLHAMNEAGIKGMTCQSNEEWVERLKCMIIDENKRREAGVCGRSFVETFCSQEILLSRWDVVLSSIGFSFDSERNILK